MAEELQSCRYAHLATHGFFAAAGERGPYANNPREQTLYSSELDASVAGNSVARRNPLLLSGVVVSGANLPVPTDEFGIPTAEDGILTAEEIVGLDLRNLELITLSACETGLGEVAAGEGVFGLQRAFHQAGTRTVIASLWQVKDSATRALMSEFYKNLWTRKMTKVEALRQAQLTMLAAYSVTEGRLLPDLEQSSSNQSEQEAPAANPDRLPPRFWAGFQLSGDWR